MPRTKQFPKAPLNHYPSFDEQYIKLVKRILEQGVKKGDPQGVGNLSVHGYTFTFDLSQSEYPFLGLRDLSGSRKAMAEELFWIMSGSTNVKDLHKENV